MGNASVEQLKGCLINPGRFSILLLGHPGSGKSHWLDAHWKEIGCNNPMITQRALRLNDYSNINSLFDVIQSANQGMFVIDHVEDLSEKSQALMFDLMSTRDGKFRVSGREEELEVRMVFTSSLSVKALLGHDGLDDRRLSNQFFDRIAQLVVEMPSFNQEPKTEVWKAFNTVWGYMWKKEKKSPPIPPLSFRLWLENNTHLLRGSYRDLEKLAINWRHWQQQGKTDLEEIQELVIGGFKNYYHSPTHGTEGLDIYSLNPDMNYDDLLKGFRKKVREWSKRFGNPALAAKKLGVSKRTMERW